MIPAMFTLSDGSEISFDQLTSIEKMTDGRAKDSWHWHRCEAGCCFILHFDDGTGCLIRQNGETVDKNGKILLPATS